MTWQYSRNRRLHWIDDGELYNSHWLWEIKDCTPYGYVREKDGYDLLYKGKVFGHARTVAELKLIAARRLS